MKHLLIIIVLFLSVNAIAQDISGCESISMKDKKEIRAAEPCVKKLSAYVLSQPMYGYSEEAGFARKVVLGWADKTPDYGFSLNKHIMKIIKGDNLLLFNVYFASQVNAALTKGKDFDKYALELFVKYISDPKNKVKQTRAVKKLIKNWKKQEIDKYLG